MQQKNSQRQIFFRNSLDTALESNEIKLTENKDIQTRNIEEKISKKTPKNTQKK